MRKLGITLQSLGMIGALGVVLTGCPVWSSEGFDDRPPTVRDGGTNPDAGGGGGRCTTDSQCPGGFCDRASGTCTASTRCATTTDCPAGQYCDGRSVCVPGCSTSANCASLGAGFVCDTATRRCAPGGLCTTDAQCAATPSRPVCLGGVCQPRTNLCQFDYQCTGSGQSCVDGQCVVQCTANNVATACAAGQVCTNNRCAYPTMGDCGGRCTIAQICVSGACLATCTSNTTCGAGNICQDGVCRVDTRPRPFCTMDSECSNGSVCHNGACRLACPDMSSMTCSRVDVNFNTCANVNGRYFCVNSNEQQPQCARTADCAAMGLAGRECVNARCL
jgi:hypothetical protein